MFLIKWQRNLNASFDDTKSSFYTFPYTIETARQRYLGQTVAHNTDKQEDEENKNWVFGRWRMLAAEQLAHVICVDCTLAVSWRNQSPAWAWTASTSHGWQEKNIGTSFIFIVEKWKQHKQRKLKLIQNKHSVSLSQSSVETKRWEELNFSCSVVGWF